METSMTKTPQRKDLQTSEDVIANTGMRKHRATQARSQPRPSGAEEPRAVYLAACERVAVALTPEGFRYAKSGPHLTRVRGDWKERVSFQSSHSNVAGEHVALWVHAYLENEKLKEWRQRTPSPFRRDAWVAGGQIGNLHRQHRWIDWDLAEPARREATILDVIREIRETALGYFALVEDVPEVSRKLLEEDVPMISLDSAVDLLLCFVGKDEARAFLRGWRARHADLEDEMKRALADLSSRASLPDAGLYANRPYAQMYAVVVSRYDL
jgi:hypothetical protein